jgi:tetratricopeptide (TPR) repeat protein
MNKWEEASRAYQQGYNLSKNPTFLINKAACHEQLNQIMIALECFERLLELKFFNMNVAGRKMRLHLKLHQFEEAVEVYEQLAKDSLES